MFRSPRDQFNPPVPIDWSKICEKNYNETYACDMCSESGWTSETEVEIHKTKRHYRRVFMNELRKRDDYCYICIKKCANRESVVRHIKSEHLLSTETCLRVEREIFVCDHCSSIFFNKENIAIHLQYAHLDMTNMHHVKCLFCHKNILIRNIPGHFYLHNIQSVSTCRICLVKCQNTNTLTEHLKTHPYYLKCDMCYYETSRLDAFRNHVLTTHKNSVKMEISTTDDNHKLMTDGTVTDKYFMTDSVKRETLTDEDDSFVEKDLLTILEMMDMDTDDTIDFDSLMTDGIKGKKRKKKLYSPKNNIQQKMLIAVENATVYQNVMKSSATQTYMKSNVLTAKDLSTDHTDSDDLITIKDLVTDSVNTDKDVVSGEIFTNESTMDEDLMTVDVKSENNLVTVIEISESKTTNADSNVITYEIQTLDSTESVDSTTDQVSDSEIVTVIEIRDPDLVTANTVTATYCADNIQTDKLLMSKDEDFRRFFIPDCPTFVRLQRIAGIRGIRLSNDVHVCILCREVCVGLREMRSHVNEHKVKKEEAQNTYECSCGEQFTNKVLLKHHAFKNQHVLN